MKTQVPWWRTSFGTPEIEAIGSAIRAERISQGSITEEFERRFASALGVSFAVATTSGSVALLLSMMAAKIEEGDEVLVPDRTWIATAHAALMLRAKVVLVDTLPHIPVMDLSQAERLITPKTKAIVPVHMNGRSTDMVGVQDLAQRYGLIVIEDACQAMFSRDRAGLLGTIGEFGCFSLGASKLISTGQGGFIITNDEDRARQIRLLRNHGVVDNFTDRWNQLGFNFKFTDIQAAMGLAQMDRIAHRLEHLRTVYRFYQENLKTLSCVSLIPFAHPAQELPLYVDVVSEKREKLISFLLERGIQPRPYPPSLHTSSYMPQAATFECSEMFAERGMYLPCGPELPMEYAEATIETLREFDARM